MLDFYDSHESLSGTVNVLEQTLINRGQLLVTSCYWQLTNELMDSSKTDNEILTYNK